MTRTQKDGTSSNPSSGRSTKRTMCTRAKSQLNKIPLGARGSVKRKLGKEILSSGAKFTPSLTF